MHKMGDLAMGSPELLPYQQEWLALQLQYEKVLGKRFSDLDRLPTHSSGQSTWPHVRGMPTLMAEVRKAPSQEQGPRKTVDKHCLLTPQVSFLNV